MASCSCSCGWKAIIWWTWAIHALISATYLGLLVTSGNNISRTTITGDYGQLYKSGLMACIVLSFIVVFLFLVSSPIIMLGRVFGASLTLWYGMLIGSGWNSAWVVLLSGLVLNAANQLATNLHDNRYWSDSDFSAFQATYAFAYIQCASFVLLIILLFLGRGALGGKGATTTTTNAGGEAYQVSGPSSAAVGGNTSGNVELPTSKTSQWPPPGQAVTSGNAGTGAWSGWNGGTQV